MGGKSRIAKDIAKTILACTQEREHYVEPFLGAGAVASVLAPHFHKVSLSDASPDLMALWSALQCGWMPPETITRAQYDALRRAPVSALRGFAGYGCSFGGKWFGGYAHNNDDRNYAGTAGRLLSKRIGNLGNVKFMVADYRDVTIGSHSVVYCDPPYRSMTKYARLSEFDNDEFWKRMESWSLITAVFVSEYDAPPGWQSVLEVTPQLSLKANSNSSKATERLWVYRGKCVN